MSVKNIALVTALGCWSSAQQKHLTEVAGRRVDAARGSVGEGCDLGRAGFEQVGEFLLPADGKDVSAISRARKEAAALIKRQGIHDVLVRTPQAAGGTVGGDAINLRAACGSQTPAREADRRRWSVGRSGDHDPALRPGARRRW